MVNFYPVFLGGDNLEKVVEHLNYIKDLIGADHIGIGGDYDGVGQTPIGLEDVSKYPALFDALATEGLGYEPWTREELQKLAGLNLIRVLRDVELVRDALKLEKPYEGLVPYDDYVAKDPDAGCRSDTDTLRPISLRDMDDDAPEI
jgi:membrane dipeptidase